MSFSMFARPMPKNPPAPVYVDLKHAIAEGFLGQSGSLRSTNFEITGDLLKMLDTWLKGFIAGTHGEQKEEALAFLSYITANPQGIELWVGDWCDFSEVEPIQLKDWDPEES